MSGASPALAEEAGSSAAAAIAIKPRRAGADLKFLHRKRPIRFMKVAIAHDLRKAGTNDVHASSVRRIATITPDMIAPKPHEVTPVRELHRRAVRESKNNIAKRS